MQHPPSLQSSMYSPHFLFDLIWRDPLDYTGMLEKLGEGGMRGKLGAKKWQWRLLSLNEETLAWYAEASAGGGAGGTAEDSMTEMVRQYCALGSPSRILALVVVLLASRGRVHSA